MDRLQAIEIFLNVAQTGSLSAAAARMELSKSTVSKQVAALEGRLATRLFNRTTRRLSLTHTGEIYREHCERILQEVAESEIALNHYASGPRGRLKVNAPMSFGVSVLSPLLCSFMQQYPEISIDLSLNDRKVDLLDEGYDVALRIGELDDNLLRFRKLSSLEVIVAASPAYLEKNSQLEKPDDLINHNCLRYTIGVQARNWTLVKDDQCTNIAVRGNYSANNGDVLKTAAIKGQGVVMLPRFIMDDAFSDGSLVQVLGGWQGKNIDLHALYPDTRHVSPKLRVFIDFLLNCFRQNGKTMQ